MDISKSLKDIGFTQNEIDIYTYMLQSGTVFGTEVYKKLSMDKSSFYRALNTLKKKELVYSHGETRNQKFKARDPSKLLTLQREKEQEIQEAGKNIHSFIKEIDRYTKENFKSNNIKIYEGDNAYFLFMEEILRGKVSIMRDFSLGGKNTYKYAGSKEKYYDFLNNYFIPKRIEKGIHIKILYDKTVLPDDFDISNPKTLKECRQCDEKLNLECFLNTFGDRSGFISEKAGKFWAIIIKDRMITNLLNSMFDIIWNKSKIINNK
jgi:sugar-specific transcriptional regulator TrmB